MPVHQRYPHEKGLFLFTVVSLLLHLSILLLPYAMQKPSGGVDEAQDLPGPFAQPESVRLTLKPGGQQSAGGDCPHSYLGIGIYWDQTQDGMIYVVQPGYPAYEAGIRPGDRIKRRTVWKDSESLLVLHGNELRYHQLPLVTICVGDP